MNLLNRLYLFMLALVGKRERPVNVASASPVPVESVLPALTVPRVLTGPTLGANHVGRSFKRPYPPAAPGYFWKRDAGALNDWRLQDYSCMEAGRDDIVPPRPVRVHTCEPRCVHFWRLYRVPVQS